VPAPRRGRGCVPRREGCWAISGRDVRAGAGSWFRESRLPPEALDPEDITAFLTDLCTHRDRALLLGGLRASEVRRLAVGRC
jgi:integrase/recombinase XerC